MLWSKRFETGNRDVDIQHKEIFRLVQQLLDSDAFENRKEKIETALDFLGDYAVNHFAAEEALMRECNYPDIESHVLLHDHFTKEVGAFVDKFKKEGDTISVSETINSFVVMWLKEHIMDRDKTMAAYYQVWEAAKR